MKKYLFSLITLCSALSLNAQQYAFDFLMISTSPEGADTLTLHFARMPKKMAARLSFPGTSESFIIDSTESKIVELISTEDGKEAFVSYLKADQEEEEYGFTGLYDFLTMEIAEESEYKLLAEKKNIQGFECRKINILENGTVFGTAWVASGIHFGLTGETGFFLTPKGTIIELELKDGEQSMSLRCTGARRNNAVSLSDFSTVIPADYEVYDESELEYYDDEESEE